MFPSTLARNNGECRSCVDSIAVSIAYSMNLGKDMFGTSSEAVASAPADINSRTSSGERA
jgi:hypothetical protein